MNISSYFKLHYKTFFEDYILENIFSINGMIVEEKIDYYIICPKFTDKLLRGNNKFWRKIIFLHTSEGMDIQILDYITGNLISNIDLNLFSKIMNSFKKEFDNFKEI